MNRSRPSSVATARLDYVRRHRPDLLRVAMRMARGVKPGQIAKECMTTPEIVEAMVKSADFEGLVEACKASIALPAEERLAQLEALALDFIEIAIARRDVRVILYFFDQLSQGKNPARAVASSLDQRLEASKHPPPQPRRRTPTAPRPLHRRESVQRPWARAMRAGAARLRHDILHAVPTPSETAPPQLEACVPNTTSTDDRPTPLPFAAIGVATRNVARPARSQTSALAILSHRSRDGPR